MLCATSAYIYCGLDHGGMDRAQQSDKEGSKNGCKFLDGLKAMLSSP